MFDGLKPPTILRSVNGFRYASPLVGVFGFPRSIRRIEMAVFTCQLTFPAMEPARRIWLCICSKSGEQQRIERTWTDGSPHPIELRDLEEGNSTEHALIAFRRGHPPLWSIVARPAVGDTVQLPLTFEPEIKLPLRIWIVTGDFERQRLRALNSVLLANGLLYEEATGIVLEPVEIIDATAQAAGSPLVADLSWSNYDQVAGHVRALEQKTGTYVGSFDKLALNVFYVNTIINTEEEIHGQCCSANGRSAIAIDRFGLDDLLLHEIGHALSLADIRNGDKPHEYPETGLYNFGNVMQSISSRRYFFTEGQILGMHFNPTSLLNTGRVPGRRDAWYDSVNKEELKSRLSLAEDQLRFPDHHTMMPLYSLARSESSIERQVAASRIRYSLRTGQLKRQLSNDTDNITGSAVALRLMQLEDYVATDIARLYEHRLQMQNSRAHNIADMIEIFRNDLVREIGSIAAKLRDISPLIEQYSKRLQEDIGQSFR